MPDFRQCHTSSFHSTQALDSCRARGCRDAAAPQNARPQVGREAAVATPGGSLRGRARKRGGASDRPEGGQARATPHHAADESALRGPALAAPALAARRHAQTGLCLPRRRHSAASGGAIQRSGGPADVEPDARSKAGGRQACWGACWHRAALRVPGAQLRFVWGHASELSSAASIAEQEGDQARFDGSNRGQDRRRSSSCHKGHAAGVGCRGAQAQAVKQSAPAAEHEPGGSIECGGPWGERHLFTFGMRVGIL